jgi:hypothetical protein
MQRVPKLTKLPVATIKDLDLPVAQHHQCRPTAKDRRTHEKYGIIQQIPELANYVYKGAASE